jgi:hypothetical protein
VIGGCRISTSYGRSRTTDGLIWQSILCLTAGAVSPSRPPIGRLLRTRATRASHGRWASPTVPCTRTIRVSTPSTCARFAAARDPSLPRYGPLGLLGNSDSETPFVLSRPAQSAAVSLDTRTALLGMIVSWWGGRAWRCRQTHSVRILQSCEILIRRLHQKQPARRRRRVGFGPVPRFEQFRERYRRAQTAADRVDIKPLGAWRWRVIIGICSPMAELRVERDPKKNREN